MALEMIFELYTTTRLQQIQFVIWRTNQFPLQFKKIPSQTFDSLKSKFTPALQFSFDSMRFFTNKQHKKKSDNKEIATI